MPWGLIFLRTGEFSLHFFLALTISLTHNHTNLAGVILHSSEKALGNRWMISWGS